MPLRALVPPPTALRYRIGNDAHDLSRRALVMGILNVTPDSFSDGGKFADPERAVEHAHRLAADGADLIDIGGESTRPGSQPVTTEEEISRIAPVLERLLPDFSIPISIDTSKPEVARFACERGVPVVNDITGLRARDEDGISTLARIAAEHGASVVVMHMQGRPETMQEKPSYRDVVDEIVGSLGESAQAAREAGVAADRIALDPGIGFGKALEHNLRLLSEIDRVVALGYPVLIGVSRKSLFQKLLDLPLEERLEAGLAVTVTTYLRGARLFRTHDVRPTVRALRTAEAIL